MKPLPQNWTVFANAEQLAHAAVAHIVACARDAITSRGKFLLVTAGGTTPNRCYRTLRRMNQDWSKWYIFMGDERVLPADHADRNSVALEKNWLDFNKIPAEHIALIPAELGMVAAAEAYEERLQKVGRFDLVLLGMGEDGHTASLFPGHDTINQDAEVLMETASPKPPAERISLSSARFCRSRSMLKLITGSGKHPAIQAWLAGQTLPIARLEAELQTLVYLDESAWLGDNSVV